MPELVKFCDVAVGNEENADKVFDIKASEVDVVAGSVHPEDYRRVCEGLASRFPNLKTVGITLRVNALVPGFFLTEQNRFLLVDEQSGELTERGHRIIAHTSYDQSERE